MPILRYKVFEVTTATNVMSKQTLPPEPETATKTAESSPFLIEFFMVQGCGFRCMAYRDEDGRWRAAFNNEELYGDVRILE